MSTCPSGPPRHPTTRLCSTLTAWGLTALPQVPHRSTESPAENGGVLLIWWNQETSLLHCLPANPSLAKQLHDAELTAHEDQEDGSK